MRTKKLSKDTKKNIIINSICVLIVLFFIYQGFLPRYRIITYTNDFITHNLITEDNKINENGKIMDLKYMKESNHAFKYIDSYSSDELLQIYPKLLCQYDKICVTILLVSRGENSKIKEQIRDCNLYLDDKLPIKDEMRINELKRKIANSDTFFNNNKELEDEIYKRISLDPGYSTLKK